MLDRVLSLTGMQIRTNKFLRERNEVLRAINVTTDMVGALTIRDGYTIIGAQIEDTKSVLANYEFKYGLTPTRKHLVVVDDTIYVNVAGTWTAQSGAGTGLTANSKGRFTQYLDTLFYVNFDDATRSYDGTNWSTSTQVTSAPKAKFIEVYKDRLVFAYVNYGSVTYPDRFVVSELPDLSDAITYANDDNNVRVPIRNDDALTGLSVNGGYLLISSLNTLWRYDGTFAANRLIPISWEFGNVNQEAMFTKDNFTFGFSLKGPWVYDGGKPQLIGRQLQPLLDLIDPSNYANICGGADGDHAYWYLGTLTAALEGDGAALTNVVIDYNMASNDWTIWTIAHVPKVFGHYTNSSGKKVLSFGDNDAQVFTLNSGTTDGGTEIDATITHRLFPAGPEHVSLANFLYAYGYEVDDLDVQFSVDGGTFSTAKSLTGDGQRVELGDLTIDPFGRQFDFKFTGRRSTAKSRLEGYTLDFEPQGLDIK